MKKKLSNLLIVMIMITLFPLQVYAEDIELRTCILSRHSNSSGDILYFGKYFSSKMPLTILCSSCTFSSETPNSADASLKSRL